MIYFYKRRPDKSIMGLWPLVIIYFGNCAQLLLAYSQAPVNITVGYLMAQYNINHFDFGGNLQGKIISGAMSYATEKVNNDTNLLPGHTLHFKVEDTKAQTLVGTKKVIELWKNGAIAYFGPENHCDTEARVAAALNLPMISYVST